MLPDLVNPLVNVDAALEAAVLGSAIMEPALLSDILNILPESSVFHDTRHQHIYTALKTAYHSREPVDMLTVTTYLHKNALLDKVPIHFITEVIGKGVGTNIEGKCRRLLELFYGRSLVSSGQKLTWAALDPTVDKLELLSRTQADLTTIVSQMRGADEPSPADYLKSVLVDLEAKKKGTSEAGLTTGIPILDARTGGFEPGNFVVLAARPGIGKTALLIHWLLHHTIDRQRSAGLFSFEMTGKEILRRAVAHRTGYSNFQLQQAAGIDLAIVHRQYDPLATMPLFFT